MIGSKRLVLIISGLIFKLSLEFAYANFVVTQFGYMGFEWLPRFAMYVLSTVLVVACFAAAPIMLRKPSDIFKIFLLVVPIVPMLVLMALGGFSVTFAVSAVLSYMLILLPGRIPYLKVPVFSNGMLIATLLALISVVTVIIYKLSQGGLSYATLDLTRVHQLRKVVSDEGAMAYLVPWTVMVFNIFLMTSALLYRRISFLVAVVVLQVFLFSVTGHKTVLVYAMLVVVLYYYVSRRPLAREIVLGFTAVIAVSLGVWLMFGELLTASIFVRRLLFVPAQVNFFYFEMFSQLEQFVWFSNSLTAPLVEYPFDQPVPRLVSEYAFGNPDVWVNSGYLGAGFAQIGWLGLLLYTVIIKFLLWLTDGLARKLPLWFSTSLLAPPFLVLFTSADLPTTLLSHGLLVAIIILWLAGSITSRPRKQQGSETLDA